MNGSHKKLQRVIPSLKRQNDKTRRATERVNFQLSEAAVCKRQLLMATTIINPPASSTSWLICIIVGRRRTRATLAATTHVLWTRLPLTFSAGTAVTTLTSLGTPWSAARCRPWTAAWVRSGLTEHSHISHIFLQFLLVFITLFRADELECQWMC